MVQRKRCPIFLNMFPSKARLQSRGQELSLTTIVVIALALLVLVIIGTIFLKQSENASCTLDEFNIKINCNEACAEKSSLGSEVFDKCVESCKQDLCTKGGTR